MSGDLDDDAPGFDDVLAIAARSEIALTHGPIPAAIIAYNAATQRADVQRVIGETNELGIVEPAPIRQGVPVAWPVIAGLGSITWPLPVGTPVTLVPLDADVSLYAVAGSTGQAAPTPRSCSWSDCIVLPWSLVPASSPLPATAYAADGVVIAGLTYLGSSAATDFAAMAAKVLTELQAIKQWADAHTHGYLGDSGVPAITSPPVIAPYAPPVITLNPMPAPGSVACTKAKVI